MNASTKENDFKNLWTTEQIRDGAMQFAAFEILEKLYLVENFPQAADQLCKYSAEQKADYLKSKGIIDPLALVQHLARFEANLFGSTVSVTGDQSKATLHKEYPKAWLEAKKRSHLSPEQEEKTAGHQKQFFNNLASNLGLTVEIETASDRNSEKVTFAKP